MAGSTPVYGFPYPEPTDLVADYPALGQDLAEDIEAVLPTLGGLSPATPTSIANSGGSASLTGNTVTFSGCSSISLNGCFTGDFDNYRVLIRTTASGNIGQTFLRLRASGTDSTSGYEYNEIYADFGGTPTNESSSSASQINSTYHSDQFDVSIKYLDFSGPALAAQTIISGTGMNTTSSLMISARHSTTSAYDGFTLYTGSGTITGTVFVYGYKK